MPESEQSQQIVPKAPFPKCSRAEGPGPPLGGAEGRQKTGEARQAAEMGAEVGGTCGGATEGAGAGAYLALGCPCAAGRPSRNLPSAARRGYRVFLDLLEKRRTLLFSPSQKGLLLLTALRYNPSTPPRDCYPCRL